MRAKRITVRYTRECKAAPSTVFALLRDSSTYPAWSQIRGYAMERPGFHESHGVGEIRVFTSRLPITVREEIVEVIPNHSVAYILISGLPMREYRGKTTLDVLANGRTRITWQSSFCGMYGTGWIMRLFMSWVLKNLTSSLARAAESESFSPKPTSALHTKQSRGA